MTTYDLEINTHLFPASLDEARFLGQSIEHLLTDVPRTTALIRITERGPERKNVSLYPPAPSQGYSGRQETSVRIRNMFKLINARDEVTEAFVPEEVEARVSVLDDRVYSIDFAALIDLIVESGFFPDVKTVQTLVRDTYSQVVGQEAAGEVARAFSRK